MWTGQLGLDEEISRHVTGKNIPGSQDRPRKGQDRPRKGQEVGSSMNKMIAGTGSSLGGRSVRKRLE